MLQPPFRKQKKSSRAVAFALPLLLALAMPALVPTAKAAEPAPPPGFTALFNGKDLSGWHGMPHFDPRKLAAMTQEQQAAQIKTWTEDARQHWTVEDGDLVNDGKGAYLTTNREFGDIELLIDYKTVPKADSGIYLRGTPQVQIWDTTKEGGKWDRNADKGSGGLFNNTKGGPGQLPAEHADKPFGEWNHFRIVQTGARTWVWLNEKLVVDGATMENYWDRGQPLFAKGSIQLQTHGGEIRWKNIFVREIPADEANKLLSQASGPFYEPLFDGKSLAGWQGDTDQYEVRDGAIVCKPGQGGNLFTTEKYDDFSVQFEFQLPEGGNNGLAIRYPGEGRPHLAGMCELQILDNEHPKYEKLDPRQYHGSAYGMAAAQRGFLRPTGEWNHQRVTVVGSTLQVELNGAVILNTDLAQIKEFKGSEPHPGKDLRSGYFGFAGHGDAVAFRKVGIKPLGSAPVSGKVSYKDGKPVANAKVIFEPADGGKPLEVTTDGQGNYQLSAQPGTFKVEVKTDQDAVSTWPQFRGPAGTALAAGTGSLPSEIGPEKNVLWKVATPPGHGSPVLDEKRIYLVAEEDGKLFTLCLDRSTGKELWRAEAPHDGLEEIHRIGSHAQSTPATDGERVVSFFGSCGLFCHDTSGKQLWHQPLGPFKNDFGAATSPIIVDDRVILVQDHDVGSFLAAYDKRTGQQLWLVDRSEFPRNYCSPIVAEIDGKKQIIVAATLRVVGYDVADGRELWTVRGISRVVCTTPVVGPGNMLYVSGWAVGGDAGERVSLVPFDEAIAKHDANGNGTLEQAELTKGDDVERRYAQIDRDKSQSIDRGEYEFHRTLFDVARNVTLGIRLGGQGDLTQTNIAWEYSKFVPFCASPILVDGTLFTVKDGGILTSLNAKTGEQVKTARLPGTGSYYASPVAGDGKLYICSQKGQVSVVNPQGKWEVISEADFGEEIYATPAIVDGRIYLRTAGHLYCLGVASR